MPLMPFSAENTFKASAALLVVFGLQMLLVPEFLLSQNFTGTIRLDRWHHFIFRGCGAAFLSSASFYWNTAKEADKYMLGATVTWITVAAVLPWYAQMNLPVKNPMHLVPTIGTLLLAASHVKCLATAPKAKKSRR